MHPNGSEWIRKPRKARKKPQKTCENFEKLRKNFEKLREKIYNFFFHGVASARHRVCLPHGHSATSILCDQQIRNLPLEIYPSDFLVWN